MEEKRDMAYRDDVAVAIYMLRWYIHDRGEKVGGREEHSFQEPARSNILVH